MDQNETVKSEEVEQMKIMLCPVRINCCVFNLFIIYFHHIQLISKTEAHGQAR